MSSNASNETDLYIAIGNPLRRDDGAAAKVIEALKPAASLVLIQPTIELAAAIATARRVIFLDAAVGGKLRLETLEESFGSGLSHAIGPGEIVAVSRRLYGFTGEAWLCRIPGKDFGVGEGLSRKAMVNVALAVRLLRER